MLAFGPARHFIAIDLTSCSPFSSLEKDSGSSPLLTPPSMPSGCIRVYGCFRSSPRRPPSENLMNTRLPNSLLMIFFLAGGSPFSASTNPLNSHAAFSLTSHCSSFFALHLLLLSFLPSGYASSLEVPPQAASFDPQFEFSSLPSFIFPS